MASNVSFTLELSQEASITYVNKFQGIFITQKLQLSEGDDNQRPLTCNADNKVDPTPDHSVLLCENRLLATHAPDNCLLEEQQTWQQQATAI